MSAASRPTDDLREAADRFSWRDVITRDELAELTRLTDWRSAWMIAVNWALVFASFALVSVWPNPLTIIVALLIIGARQLGFAVVMHEASHRTLFSNRKVNDWVGNWLGAYPIWSDHEPYRPYHLLHHAHTGTPKDPDLGLAAPFPITRGSFARKCLRDLTGQTGWKQAVAVFKRDVGVGGRATQRTKAAKAGQRPDVGWHKLFPTLLTNFILFGIVTAFGHPEVYLLWVVAWFTTYRLVMRIRAIAEHAMATDLTHPLQNTRTTRLSWWERLFVGPNFVNYHLEHHLVMTVPSYNLPKMHALLRSRGVYDGDALVADGYAAVLRSACSKRTAQAA